MPHILTIIAPFAFSLTIAYVTLRDKMVSNKKKSESNSFVISIFILTVLSAAYAIYSAIDVDHAREIADLAKIKADSERDAALARLQDLQKIDIDSARSLVKLGNKSLDGIRATSSSLGDALSRLDALNTKSNSLVNASQKNLVLSEKIVFPLDTVDITFSYSYTVPASSFYNYCPAFKSDSFRRKNGNSADFSIGIDEYRTSKYNSYVQGNEPNIGLLIDTSSNIRSLSPQAQRNSVYIYGLSITNKSPENNSAFQVHFEKDQVIISIYGYYRKTISQQGNLRVIGVNDLFGMFLKFHVPVPQDIISCRLSYLRIATDKVKFQFEGTRPILKPYSAEFVTRIARKNVVTVTHSY